MLCHPMFVVVSHYLSIPLLFIGVAVSNNTPGAELVAVGKLIASGCNLHHCLPDLRRLHRRADRCEEPVQKCLTNVRLFIGRADVIGAVGNDAQFCIAGKTEQDILGLNLHTHPHCRGIFRDVTGTDEMKADIGFVTDLQPRLHKLCGEIDMDNTVGFIIHIAILQAAIAKSWQ